MRLVFVLLMISSVATAQQAGKPFNKNIQMIPGRIECEWYDEGGEGMAYHDSDSINNGSGKLNPINGNPLHEFRLKEGVDISYTKTNAIDNNPYNRVAPALNSLYVGWTEPGEWIRYTVKVERTGDYNVGLMYTANGDGEIALDIDGKVAAGALVIPSTNDAADTIAWRQWHHWNKLDNLTTLHLTRGVHVLTLRVVKHGNMNFDYFEFALKP